MNSDSQKSVDAVEEAIFMTACELEDPAARAAYLDRSCGHDTALRARVEKLLSAHARANEFFGGGAKPDVGLPAFESQDIPTERIGRYKLLQKIGEGGMGIVYMAEQLEPVRRRVALKIIKLGMDTRSVVARFEAERQALALMDHPNIARILDGGATETGRPYFVMELVQGVAITEYCDKNHLPVGARIELFLKVCDAVQSAHQKGIIHRDLKPSNIMVTLHDGAPVPKVIDFGVAKATNQELTAKTLFTNHATLIGAPAYMSPEQAEMSGLDVDTRSDIYSLGALLYELLTGSTPFPEQRLRSVGYGEMQRIISQEEPQRLPTRISTMDGGARNVVARNRNAEVTALRKHLSGDLDSIVLKCLEKDRTRRYESASGLAADIRRHLQNEPVLARPANAAYQIRKFVRRNHTAVTVASIIVLALTTAVIISTISYRREKFARAAAETLERAEATERRRAEAEALRAARLQYASDMNLARLAAEDGNFFRSSQLLDRHRPSSALTNSHIPDLRGWEWRYIWKQSQSDELAFLGRQTGSVDVVGFTPDGTAAFAGGKDGALRFWDLKTRQQTTIIPHPDRITGAAFSSDGRWLATTAVGSLFIREWPAQRLRTTISSHWFRQNTLHFSPNNKLLAFCNYGAATNEGAVFLWDIENARRVAALPFRVGWMAPTGFSFSADSRSVVYAADEAGNISFWSIEKNQLIRKWRAHEWYIPGVFLADDGKLVISGSADRTVKIWDAATEKQIAKFEYPLGFGPSRVCAPRLSPNGKLLATATVGGGVAISIQEIPSGRERLRLRGNHDMVSWMEFSPDSSMLVSGSFDGAVRLWGMQPNIQENDARTFSSDHKPLRVTANAISLSPDGRHLMSAFTNGTFSIRELPSMKESPRFNPPAQDIAAFALGTRGRLAGYVSTNGEVFVRQEDSGRTTNLGRPTTNEIVCAVFSLDGNHFAAAGDNDVTVCDLASGKWRVLPARTEDHNIFSIRLSPDGQKVMTSYFDGTVRFWDVSKTNPGMILKGHDWQVNNTLLMPDQKTLLSVSHEIHFWDLATGTIRQTLQPRSALFRALAISPDGNRLAVGAADGFINIWDLNSMQEVAILAGHKRPLIDMRFLPDGDTLVSASVDEVRVWRAASPQEVDAP